MVRPRIVGFYHTLGGLECYRNGCVPKNQMHCSQLTVGFVCVHLRSKNSIYASSVDQIEMRFCSLFVCRIIEMEENFVRNGDSEN